MEEVGWEVSNEEWDPGSWHILGDRLIPLAPFSFVGFYMWAPN